MHAESFALPLLFGALDMPPAKKTHRRASDGEELLRQLLPASGAATQDPEMEAEMKTSVGLSRMVDMRIPLWGILSGMGALALVLVNMWFSVQQLTASMADVQLTLKAGNGQTTTTLVEIERLKGRLDRAEDTYRDLQQQMMQQQMRERAAAK